MAILPIIYGPAPIFQQQAEPVTVFDAQLAITLQDMADTLYHHQALGIGANMVGLLQQLIVIDLQENGERQLYKMVNPTVIYYGSEIGTYPESSLSFPGIQVAVKRPTSLVISYQDAVGVEHKLSADGLLARVIQHELDYLQGKTFLDAISLTKKKILLRKIKKTR